MPSGILGEVDLAAATNATLFVAEASKVTSFSVNFCNRNSASVTVRLAVASSASPANSSWLIYDVVVAGNSALERTGLIVDGGKLVVVQASAVNVSVMAFGYVE